MRAAPFACVEIGEEFMFSNSMWRKQSTRTAFSIKFNRVFYFGESEMVLS